VVGGVSVRAGEDAPSEQAEVTVVGKLGSNGDRIGSLKTRDKVVVKEVFACLLKLSDNTALEAVVDHEKFDGKNATEKEMACVDSFHFRRP
jgi:hypothetical protein